MNVVRRIVKISNQQGHSLTVNTSERWVAHPLIVSVASTSVHTPLTYGTLAGETCTVERG